MFKVFLVVCVLCACAFADTFTPVVPNCSYHMATEDSEEGAPVHVDVYVMHNGTEVYTTMHYLTAGMNVTRVMRSDVKNEEGQALLVVHVNTMCSELFVNISAPGDNETFEYTGTPEDVICPDNITNGCKQYCNSNKECVTADPSGRIAKNVNGTRYFYYDDAVDPQIFAVFRCDESELLAPPDYCAAYTTKVMFGLVLLAIFIALL